MPMPMMILSQRMETAVARVTAAFAETRNPQTLLLNRRYASLRLALPFPPLVADDEVRYYEHLRAELLRMQDELQVTPDGVDAREALVLRAETIATRLVVWAAISVSHQ